MVDQRCTYCPRSATTKDHIPPECFFAKPLPGDLLTVPACDPCNSSFGHDDGFVRNLLISLADTEDHPTVKLDLRHRRNRSLSRDKKLLKRTLLSMGRIEVRSESGLVLGKAPGVNLDQPQCDRFFRRLARGLLYRSTGVALAACIADWHPLKVELVEEFSQFLRANPPPFGGSVGDSVFRYIGFVGDPEDDPSDWVTQFYEGPLFLTRLCPALLVP
jgi:hypothetical protein